MLTLRKKKVASKTEGSEILLYLQTNRSACYSFMDACGRHKTPESEAKGFITSSRHQAARTIYLLQFSWPAGITEVTQVGSAGHRDNGRPLSLGEPHLVLQALGMPLLQAHSGGNAISITLNCKETRPSLRREILYLQRLFIL